MTIPTLISNTNSAKFKSQYKKTLSTLNQAVKMAEAKYDVNFATLTHGCPAILYSEGATMQYIETTHSMCALLQSTLTGAEYTGYLDHHIKVGGVQRYSIKGSYHTPGVSAHIHSFLLADGAIVAFSPNIHSGSCSLDTGGDITTLSENCRGFIDVNGSTLPNREVTCSTGKASISSTVGDCIVRNNASDMGDIFPIVFHDGVVEPLTDAARYVLNQSK